MFEYVLVCNNPCGRQKRQHLFWTHWLQSVSIHQTSKWNDFLVEARTTRNTWWWHRTINIILNHVCFDFKPVQQLFRGDWVMCYAYVCSQPGQTLIDNTTTVAVVKCLADANREVCLLKHNSSSSIFHRTKQEKQGKAVHLTKKCSP